MPEVCSGANSRIIHFFSSSGTPKSMELGTPQNLRLAPPHNTGQPKIFVKSKALYNHELDT